MFRFPSDSEASRKRLALAVEAEKAKRLPKSTRNDEALQQYIAQRHTTPQQQCAAQKQDGAQIAQVPDTARSGDCPAPSTPDAAAPDLKPGDMVMAWFEKEGKEIPIQYVGPLPPQHFWKNEGKRVGTGAFFAFTGYRLPTPEERAQVDGDGWIPIEKGKPYPFDVRRDDILVKTNKYGECRWCVVCPQGDPADGTITHYKVVLP